MIRFSATGEARRRLFCLPYAGGGPSTYRLWPRALPDDIEVVAVVLPGRDPRTSRAGDAPLDSMEQLLPPILGAIADLQRASSLPFAIFGHSMGALVAYELAVEMEGTADIVPEHLFVSGRRAPDEVHRGALIHDLADQDFLAEMQRLYGGVPEAVRQEPELLALFLPMLRADVRVFETYAPLTDRKVSCPVRVYGGADDRRPAPDALHGWQRVADRAIGVRTFPGDHFYLNSQREPLLADLARHWTVAAT